MKAKDIIANLRERETGKKFPIYPRSPVLFAEHFTYKQGTIADEMQTEMLVGVGVSWVDRPDLPFGFRDRHKEQCVRELLRFVFGDIVSDLRKIGRLVYSNETEEALNVIYKLVDELQG